MGYIGEYTKPTVTSGGCSYSTLDNYNQNYFGRGAVSAPTLSQSRSNQIIVVPSYGGMGYNTLQNTRQPTCSGFYKVKNAYPRYPNACGAFSSNLCG